MKHYTLLAILLCLHFLPGHAQPQLTVDRETHSLGRIEWKRPVTVEYGITNTGNLPLVLTNITVSCSCTVVDWTKTPIPPGGKGVVRTTFDAESLGRFHKSVGVYSNAIPELIYLQLTGEVTTEVIDSPHQYSYAIGDILVDANEIKFSGVHRGEDPELVIGISNRSDLPYEPVLMHLPSYLNAEANPPLLRKGEGGYIRVTLDTERLPDLGLTQTSVYLSRFLGDKVSDENEIPVTVVLLPAFPEGYDESNTPSLSLSEYEVNFSLKGKSKVAHTLTLTNVGKRNLIISKLQVLNPALSIELKKSVLTPGEKVKLKISLNKEGMKNRNLKILMITNDPQNPEVFIDVNVK